MPPKAAEAPPPADLQQQIMALLQDITTARRATGSDVERINRLTAITAAQGEEARQPLQETADVLQETADALQGYLAVKYADPLQSLPPHATLSPTLTSIDQPLQQSIFYLQSPHGKGQPDNQHSQPSSAPHPREHPHIPQQHKPQFNTPPDKQPSTFMAMSRQLQTASQAPIPCPDSDIADKDAAAPMPSVADRSPSQPSRTRSPSQQAAAASTSTTPNTNQQPGRSATHANPAGAQQQRTRSRPPQGSKPSQHQPAAALQTPPKTTTPPPADPPEELKTPPDGDNGPLQEEQEVMDYRHPTIQLARSTTSKHRPPQVHARLKPDLQGPLTDRVTPPPQTKPNHHPTTLPTFTTTTS